jgi:hypothetical protein
MVARVADLRELFDVGDLFGCQGTLSNQLPLLNTRHRFPPLTYQDLNRKEREDHKGVEQLQILCVLCALYG